MPLSTRTMGAADWSQIQNFRPSEFKHPEKMGFEFLLWLDRVRDAAGVPMTITSSYRSPDYNAAVGGAQDSAHSDVPCEAVDIGKRPTANDPNWNHSRYRIMTAAMSLGCVRIGMYANGSLHLDRTEGKRPAPRIWTAVDRPAR
jgi:uncharacterized protein YcbK (DUF882 family)